MRLLVCGSRDWPGTWEDIGAHLPEPDAGLIIMHGMCKRWRRADGTVVLKPEPGAVQCSVDMLADFAARGLGHVVLPFPVDPALDGPWPGAGPRRNARMLRFGRPNRGLAFGALWKSEADARGRTSSGAAVVGVTRWKRTGTGGMVHWMLLAGLPVRWIAAPNAPPVDLTVMPPAGGGR